MKSTVKFGIYQAAAVHMDLDKSMDKLVSCIEEGAKNGLEVLILGESWLSGYPAWIDSCPEVAVWDNPAMKKVYTRMFNSSVEIDGKEVNKLGELSSKAGMVLCVGVNEKVVHGKANGTIFNSFLIFNGKDTKPVVHRRKLMPTFSEKLLYGIGDGKDIKSIETNYGNVGGLICWEHWMPLTRQAMHNSGEHIHASIWPTVHEIHQMASRHYAFEARCFVGAAGQLMKVKDIPEELTIPEELASNPEKYILRGGSCLIGPNGQFITDPLFEEEKLITHEIDIQETIGERMTLDTSGHYQRSDVFSFSVNDQRL